MNRIDWQQVPMVFLGSPACPYCEAPKPLTVRSETSQDGAVTRRQLCRNCGAPFLIVLEAGTGEVVFPLPGKQRQRPA